jgi:hypothetical protein
MKIQVTPGLRLFPQQAATPSPPAPMDSAASRNFREEDGPASATRVKAADRPPRNLPCSEQKRNCPSFTQKLILE